MGVCVPAGLELRTASNEDNDRSILNPIHQQIEDLSRCRIDPVGILKNHHHWLVARQPNQVVHQRRNRHILLLLWGKIQRTVSIAGGD